MAIYRARRIYSDNEGSGMGTLGKVALGAAALGGGLMAGKAGMLGTGIQKSIGKSMAWTGNKVGSQGLINSGAKTVGKAAKTEGVNALGGMNAIKGMNSGDKSAAISLIKGDAKAAEQGIKEQFKLSAFSEDTGAALTESAIYGGTLAAGLGGIALARKGKLGFTKAQRAGNKASYDKVVKQVKSVWNETKGAGEKTEKVIKETKKPGQAPKKETIRTTTQVIGRPRYSAADWKEIKTYGKANKIDVSDPKNAMAIAKTLGKKPLK